MKPTARYPTPPFKQLGGFFSLREAGLKGGDGLIGRDRAKIARLTIFMRATSHAALFLLMRKGGFRDKGIQNAPHYLLGLLLATTRNVGRRSTIASSLAGVYEQGK